LFLILTKIKRFKFLSKNKNIKNIIFTIIIIMNETSVNVVPCPIVQQPKYVSKFKFNVMNFIPFQSIEFRCILLTQHNEYIESRIICMSGDDYVNWGNDDSYLINYLTSRLGLTNKESVEPEMINTLEYEPAVTNDEPAVTNDEPAVTNDEPAVTNDEPAVTNDEPAVTNDEPAITNDDVINN
jgi:hypothetical protein